MRWRLNLPRRITRREDTRNQEIRELQASNKIAKEDVIKARTREMEHKEHVDLAHQRIDELLDRLDGINQKYETCSQSLSAELSAKELLETQLRMTLEQLDSAKQRIHEMEMEMSVSGGGDMLDPGDQAPATEPQDATASESASTELFNADAEDSSPSLIQCLTTEMERWKRHCHVLGEELKVQRDRLVNASSETPANDHVVLPDDLTDIKGIGKVLAKRLHDLGIYTFEQLAALDEAELENEPSLDEDFFRRMRRDDWVGQARAMQQSRSGSAV